MTFHSTSDKNNIKVIKLKQNLTPLESVLQ